jgi:hypothetical protein
MGEISEDKVGSYCIFASLGVFLSPIAELLIYLYEPLKPIAGENKQR